MLRTVGKDRHHIEAHLATEAEADQFAEFEDSFLAFRDEWYKVEEE
jgi:hypothetical protein